MRYHRAKCHRGFTLIELSVVILIITMMMLMAVPAVSRIVAQARRDLSFAILHQLEVACEEFKGDLEEYPRSSDSDYPNSEWKGSQLLRLQLTGYGPDLDDDGLPQELQIPGEPLSFASLATDDGHHGFGFRLARKGRVYGPYLATAAMDIDSRDDHSFFVDAFGHEIYYYRYDLDKKDYDDGDNDPIDALGNVVSVSEYATKPKTDKYYRIDDFVIFSAGPDGYIEAYDPDNPAASDDVTNVFPEF